MPLSTLGVALVFLASEAVAGRPVVDVGVVEVVRPLPAVARRVVQAPPALPDLDPTVLPEAVRPVWLAWLRSHEDLSSALELAAVTEVADPARWRAEREALQAIEAHAAAALRTALEAEERLPPEGWVVLGQLRLHAARAASVTALQTWSACIDLDPAPEGCEEPVMDVGPALAAWGRVGDSAPPALRAWTLLATGFALRAAGRPDDAMSVFQAARAVDAAPGRIVASAAFEVGTLLLGGTDPGMLDAFDSAARLGSRELAHAARAYRVDALLGLGRPEAAALAAFEALLAGGEPVGLGHAAGVGLARSGGAAPAIARRAPGDEAARARALVVAAGLLVTDGHHTWARADLEAARSLDPDVDTVIVPETPERADRWLARVGRWCADRAPAEPLDGAVDLTLWTRGSRVRARLSGADGALGAVLACLEADLPPPEGPIAGGVRGHVVFRDAE